MCLILFAQEPNSAVSLVVAANRDEFYQRPALAAGFWDDHPDVLGGRDQEMGGTWLGVAKGGRFAAVTNFREEPPSALPGRSRGDLPLNFLARDISADAYLRQVRPSGGEYRGFNLLLRDEHNLWYYCNRGSGNQQGQPSRLAPGCYGLSNQTLDCDWPKVREGREKLRALLRAEASAQQLTSELFALLLDEGDGREHSGSFINGETYGTRAATVLIITTKCEVHFEERCFAAGGIPMGSFQHSFNYSACS